MHVYVALFYNRNNLCAERRIDCSLVSALSWMFFAAVRKNAFINSNMNATLVSQRRAGAFA
jgi:hypothetical protein